MQKIIKEFRSLREKGLNKQIIRGKLPNVKMTNDFLRFRFIGVFIISALLGFMGAIIFFMSYKHKGLWDAMRFAWGIGLESGILVTLFYVILPLLLVVVFMLFNYRRPTRDFFERFSWDQNFGCLALIAFAGLYLFNHLTPMILRGCCELKIF